LTEGIASPDPDAGGHADKRSLEAQRPAFQQVGERTEYAGHIISLTIGTFEGPDGTRFERELVRHPGAVSVVPLHDDQTVVLVRQYRAAVDAELLEIPAGKRDVADEPLEETANRELAEEVGLHAATLEPLCTFHNSIGFSDELSHIFLGTDLTEAQLDLQGIEEEHMQIVRMPLAEAMHLVETSEITDAKTVLGLLTTARRLGI
jgi:8-oxo-dGDP phosphatase